MSSARNAPSLWLHHHSQIFGMVKHPFGVQIQDNQQEIGWKALPRGSARLKYNIQGMCWYCVTYRTQCQIALCYKIIWDGRTGKTQRAFPSRLRESQFSLCDRLGRCCLKHSEINKDSLQCKLTVKINKYSWNNLNTSYHQTNCLFTHTCLLVLFAFVRLGLFIYLPLTSPYKDKTLLTLVVCCWKGIAHFVIAPTHRTYITYIFHIFRIYILLRCVA